MTEHDFDEDLELVHQTLSAGEHVEARHQLAKFVGRFATRAEREERILQDIQGLPNELLQKVRREHDRLYGFVGMLARALACKNDRFGLDTIEMCRSLVVIHIAKEAALAELDGHSSWMT